MFGKKKDNLEEIRDRISEESAELEAEYDTEPADDLDDVEEDDGDEEYYDEDDDDEEEGRSPVMTIVTTILLIAIISAIGWGVWSVYRKFTYTPPKVEVRADNTIIVPDLSGINAADAAKILEDTTLGVKEDHSIPSEKKEGTILSQTPSAGTVVDPHTTIYLTTSGGTSTVLVPDMTGMDATAAIHMLEDLGMQKIETKKSYGEGVFGTVTDSKPKKGEEMSGADTLTLMINAGTKNTAVPENYIGMTETDAVAQAKKNRLIPQVRYVYSDIYDKGQVTSQSVEKNAPVMAGTAITLTVSNGPASRDDTSMQEVKLSMPDTATGTDFRMIAKETDGYTECDFLIDGGKAPEFPLTIDIPVMRGAVAVSIVYEETNGDRFIPRATWSVLGGDDACEDLS